MQYIYKYTSAQTIDLIFSNKNEISFKCSYPKDFNDPYELFLAISYSQAPDLLAFYSNAIGDIPQLPTTCFSMSPSVVPMWAHYANNHEGFVIELDEKTIKSFYPNIAAKNITYQNTPQDYMQENLERAYHTGKPRHMHWLHNAVMSAAYFTKSSHWSYEMERRLVLNDDDIRKTENNIMLVDMPLSCVKSIICGARSKDDTKKKLREISKKNKINFYEMVIGRGNVTPYFRTQSGRTSIFTGEKLEICKKYCSTCGEPTENQLTLCSWCQINDSHRYNAAYRNPYRALAGAGILEEYIKQMNGIRARK